MAHRAAHSSYPTDSFQLPDTCFRRIPDSFQLPAICYGRQSGGCRAQRGCGGLVGRGRGGSVGGAGRGGHEGQAAREEALARTE